MVLFHFENSPGIAKIDILEIGGIVESDGLGDGCRVSRSLFDQFFCLADAQTDEIFVRRQPRVALEEREEPCPSVAHEADQVVDMEILAIMGVEEFNGGIHHLRPRGDEWLAEDVNGAEEDAAAKTADKPLLRRGERVRPLEIPGEFANR